MTTIGQQIIRLERTGSTNLYANRLLEKGEPAEGTVVWALDQYSGRGQHDHVWLSEPGKNLTFTVILRPWFLDPQLQFRLNKAIALGVLDYIKATISTCRPVDAEPLPPVTGHPPSGTTPPAAGPLCSIKWPNDLYIETAKVGGILIEHKIMGSRLESTIAGIGLNLNQAEFDPGLPNPGSLISYTGQELALGPELKKLLANLDRRYNALRVNNDSTIDVDYDHHLTGCNQWRLFEVGGKQFEGCIRGVDDSGLLLVEDRQGVLNRYSHGEIGLFVVPLPEHDANV